MSLNHFLNITNFENILNIIGKVFTFVFTLLFLPICYCFFLPSSTETVSVRFNVFITLFSINIIPKQYVVTQPTVWKACNKELKEEVCLDSCAFINLQQVESYKTPETHLMLEAPIHSSQWHSCHLSDKKAGFMEHQVMALSEIKIIKKTEVTHKLSSTCSTLLRKMVICSWVDSFWWILPSYRH